MKPLAPIRLTILLVFATGWSVVARSEKEWPYTLPVSGPLPETANQDWVSNDIDAYILKRLQSQGITPAPMASKSTLCRRLYLDLIGLPPSPDELNDFLNDDSVDAYSKLVDRLLDDPRFGEHWARFWLDLARYADTAGYEGDPDLPHAWRYRDYVIDSFNRDKPYDQFIREQIAGDELVDITGAGELPVPPAENLVALTFLRLAPFTEPRGDESRHELLSEMTTTVSSVFLGLTVGCAKCHDHKYDPIPIEDFYRMKAFFATVQIPPPRRGDAFQIGGPTEAAFYRQGENDWAKEKEKRLRKEAAEAGSERARLVRDIRNRLGLNAGFGIQALGGKFGNDYYFDQRLVTDGKPHVTVINGGTDRWEYFTDGVASTRQGSLAGMNRGHWFSGIQKPTYFSLGAATNGTGVPALAYFQGSVAELLVFDRPLTAAEASLPIESLRQLDGLRFRLDASDVDADPVTANPAAGEPITAWTDTVSGATLRQDDEKLRPRMATLTGTDVPAIEFDGDFLSGDSAPLAFLSDKAGSIVTRFRSVDNDESYLFEVGGERQFVATFVNPSANGANLDQIIAGGSDDVTENERQRYKSLTNKEKFLPQQLKRLQPRAMTLRHSFGPPYEPGVPTSRVMLRGEWDNPGDVVEPSFLSAITGHEKPAIIRLDTFRRWPTRSRRKALADWIASPSNPLTARVIVNRLWYRHFGRGIVSTPSDFGELSDGPSHPSLLDYLAVRLVENGWSLKSIHRAICNSSTYKQESRVQNAHATNVDPDNVSLWKYPVRRLWAEVVRDRILQVSGRLNDEKYGLPIFPPLPDEIEKRVKYNDSKWATQYGPEGRKRSIYIYQQRTLNTPLLQTFDAPVCDQSRPRRQNSTTPLQALALYNGPLITAEVPHFADRVLSESDDTPESQIRSAFRIALCRDPSDEETKRLLAFCQTFDEPREAVPSICRILYNCSEFLYLN